MRKPLSKIAVIGCGVIGASWAAYFLAKGFSVAATDPGHNAESSLSKWIHAFWPSLEKQGLAPEASLDNLVFSTDLHSTVKNALFIQENGPERLDIKHSLIAAIEEAALPDTLIASSSSGLLVSDMQSGAKHPERIVLGHPFNPPHLIPLVEVVGGKLTSPETIERALEFYRSIDKKPIHIRREVKGHVANRLQAALWKEAFHLVDQGVISVADLDTAISSGPGLRWALLGPFLNLHLSGGEGGIEHLLEHLGPPIEDWWADLGQVSLTAHTNKKIIDGVRQELALHDETLMRQQRDKLLVSLLQMKKDSDQLP
ncbi:3-hydroxyacyl-CoA dehydrogenase NAD-binding domain-containing protein [Paralcaligenes sp. KSB-10]|uniref:3-hydroxyacyl-CoA dehydrogenase NAD-binding domain-containing protein n=1 Tax=Paralcaligenes sp. KSB-10 TaxID=2901142 RepID=UPI001E50ACBF|nr:3-hydroxyacyl-CoA dehydrogenase NAD-binding domain-containing protein [Paralcaligenes sp. KSB-10]UHL65962.1 3-hydroxyacyl-CoA dehydrogenase NAD-binding domain-containing protein [Paralcaligenes sp. KSB-10]